jgi:hypothetical protein
MKEVYSYCRLRENRCHIYMRAHVCQAECAVPLYIAQLASSSIQFKCFVVCTRTRHHSCPCILPNWPHLLFNLSVLLYAHELGMTFTVARICMYACMWECVFGLVQGACSLSLVRGDACICGSV